MRVFCIYFCDQPFHLLGNLAIGTTSLWADTQILISKVVHPMN